MRKLSLFDIDNPNEYREVEVIMGAYKSKLFDHVYEAVEALELATEFLNLVKYSDPETYERAKDAFYEARFDDNPIEQEV